MKQGVKPSYQQRKIFKAAGLDAREYFVIKDLTNEIVVRKRDSMDTISLPKPKQ